MASVGESFSQQKIFEHLSQSLVEQKKKGRTLNDLFLVCRTPDQYEFVPKKSLRGRLLRSDSLDLKKSLAQLCKYIPKDPSEKTQIEPSLLASLQILKIKKAVGCDDFSKDTEAIAKERIEDTFKDSSLKEKCIVFLQNAKNKIALSEELCDLKKDVGQVFWLAILFEIASEKDQKKISELLALGEQIKPRRYADEGEVTSKEIGIVFGDHFIKEERFSETEEAEGDVGSQKYARLLAQYCKTRPPSPIIKKVEVVLQNGISISDTKAFTEKNIRKKIDANGSCILFGGWTKHAVVYEIVRQEDGKYTFRIYNRGKGIQYHRSYTPEFTAKTAACIAVKDIDMDAILSPALLGVMSSIKAMEGTEKPPPEDMIATVLLPLLNGTAEEVPEGYLGFMSPQRSGTCTYMCLDALMARMLKTDEYRSFKFGFRLFLLQKNLSRLKEESTKSITSEEAYQSAHTSFQILKRSIGHFAERIPMAPSTVSEMEKREALGYCSQYEIFLKDLEAQIFLYEKVIHRSKLSCQEILAGYEQAAPTEKFEWVKALVCSANVEEDQRGKFLRACLEIPTPHSEPCFY